MSFDPVLARCSACRRDPCTTVPRSHSRHHRGLAADGRRLPDGGHAGHARGHGVPSHAAAAPDDGAGRPHRRVVRCSRPARLLLCGGGIRRCHRPHCTPYSPWHGCCARARLALAAPPSRRRRRLTPGGTCRGGSRRTMRARPVGPPRGVSVGRCHAVPAPVRLDRRFPLHLRPVSIGLSVIVVVMRCAGCARGPLYRNMTQFWLRVIGLLFAVGVATGLVMEMQFGTNWSRYSRSSGRVRQRPRAEALLAFFLESVFLAVRCWLEPGRPAAAPGVRALVALGRTSAPSGSWWPTRGSRLRRISARRARGALRAEVTDFWAVVFNPSTLQRLSTSCPLPGGGAFLVLSVAGFWMLRRRHVRSALGAAGIALPIAFAASLLQLFTGHWSAMGVSQYQPAKMAASRATTRLRHPPRCGSWDGWTSRGARDRGRAPGRVAF